MLGLAALSAALLVAAALIFLLQKWRHRKRQMARRHAHLKPKSYAAVGIRPHARACIAVRTYYKKRFLAEEAPAIPVAGCTVRPCPCRYIHYVDRRVEDRRSTFGIIDRWHDTAGTERRRGDRRHAPASV